MRVVIYLSIDHKELFKEHRGVEASGRKGRGSDYKFGGTQLLKIKHRL